MKAYTLLEMLVVLVLVLILASITALVYVHIDRDSRVNSAAAQLQGWLLEARQRAMRDSTITGLRLYGDVGPMACSQCQLIQVPEPWTGDGTVSAQYIWNVNGSTQTISTNRITANGFDFTGGLPAGSWPVNPGDSIEFNDGQAHLIVNVMPSYVDVFVFDMLQYPTGTVLPTDPPCETWNWKIVCKARPAIGEPTRPLAQNAIVDVQATVIYGGMLPAGPVGATWDILFSPSGTPATGTFTGGLMLLWVRRADADQNGWTWSGQQLLVSVKTTGAIGVDELNYTIQNPSASTLGYANPFIFTRDARSSGV